MAGRDSRHHVRHRAIRSARHLAFGAMEDQRRRDDDSLPFEGGDMHQQVQVRIAGLAFRRPVAQEVVVEWPHPFLMRVDPDASDSNAEDPHFTSGFVLLEGEAIIVDAHVFAWVTDDTERITGARVRVRAWEPDARKKTRFSGMLHLTFSGYAAPLEEDEDQEDQDDEDAVDDADE